MTTQIRTPSPTARPSPAARPSPSGAAPPAAGTAGLLPGAAPHTSRAGRLVGHAGAVCALVLTELAFVLALVDLYDLLVPRAQSAGADALAHGAGIGRVETSLGLGVEAPMQAALAARPLMLGIAQWYYAASVFVVPLLVATLLAGHDVERYRHMRMVFVATTLTAFAAFWFYPVAPPCLMVTPTGCGPTPPDPFAALPSLHVAWAAVACLGLVLLSRRWWVRALGVVHVVVTVAVVLGTAHHYLLDVVAGLVLAVAAHRVAAGPRPRRDPLRIRGDAAGGGRAASPWRP